MNRSVVVATVLATLPAASIASHSGDRATVVAVYPPEYTTAFKAARQLPANAGEDGRFAIARIGDRRVSGDASYALIYVPAGVPVAENSVVELDGSEANLLP